MRKYKFIVLLLICQIGLQSFAQLSKGGLPVSFNAEKLSQTFHEVYLPAPDYDKIAREDEISNDNRFAVLLPVDYNTTNTGTWEWLPDGSKLWRLKVTVESSLAINLYFRNFNLPEGAKMFIYDESHKQVKGAFTSINNQANGLFATDMILGDKAIIELYVPARISRQFVFYYFRSFILHIVLLIAIKGSGLCEVNVICSPEGDDWQDEKNGVVRIKVKISGALFWCSGSLVNNIREDKTPYVLTADHCAFKFNKYAIPDDLAQWIFDFNYEGENCSSFSPRQTI